MNSLIGIIHDRYKSVREAADTMQIPDREKLYLRCYRASGRTNPLHNFYWRYYEPNEEETSLSEEHFVSIDDLLEIRYSEQPSLLFKQSGTPRPDVSHRPSYSPANSVTGI